MGIGRFEPPQFQSLWPKLADESCKLFRWCVKIDCDRVLLVEPGGLTGTAADAEEIADHLAVGAISFARCFLFPRYVADKRFSREQQRQVRVDMIIPILCLSR